MKKLSQTIPALLLCVTMLFCAVSFCAFASDDAVVYAQEDTTEIILDVGEPATIRYGQYVRIHANATGVPKGYYLSVVKGDKLLYLGTDSATLNYKYGIDHNKPKRSGSGDPLVDADIWGRQMNLNFLLSLLSFFVDYGVEDDFEYTVVLMNKNGDLLRDADGKIISQSNQITVSKTFGDRALHFFNRIFLRTSWADVGPQQAAA